MRGAQMQPNVITYSAAFSACSRGKRRLDTLELMGDMCGIQGQPDAI